MSVKFGSCFQALLSVYWTRKLFVCLFGRLIAGGVRVFESELFQISASAFDIVFALLGSQESLTFTAAYVSTSRDACSTGTLKLMHRVRYL